MTALPPAATKVHLDQDSDDIYQARAEIEAHTDKINTIISYLAGLLGSDGQQLTAQSVLGVGFPSGTIMAFIQPTVPIGWIRHSVDTERYLVATTGVGGGSYGNFLHVPTTSSTVLAQGHLPSINLTAATSWAGDHFHSAGSTGIQAPNPNIASVRVAAGTSYYVFITPQYTTIGGNHQHSVTVPLGGQNWGHTHVVNLNDYRPLGILIVLGRKI